VPKIKVEKIIKAEKDKVFSTMTDFENLPSKLPQIFKSVKIISREGNSIVTKEFVKNGWKRYYTEGKACNPTHREA